MRVLLTNATDIFAGGEDYVLILARQLGIRGHDVCVSALPGHLLLEKCTAAGIPVLPLHYRGMHRVFGVGAELRREMRRRGTEIVHSNANYDRTAAAIAAWGGRARHVAGVHSAHSIRHNLTHAVRNRWGVDAFIADAEAVRNVLVQQDGIAPARVEVIPIGVEEEPAGEHDRAEARASWGAGPRTIVVGNVARLVPFKGHRYLLDAASRVLRVRKDVLFVIVGDGELEEALRAQALALGVEGSVRFLGFRDNLHTLYPGFDIYAHSSLELAAEAFPIAILRALASSLPVVATDAGGIGLMVRQGVNGELVRPEDPGALAESLLGAAADPGRRRMWGAASGRLFHSEFHAAVMADRVEALYRRVAEGGRP
ncbi:MAG: glycosyltransferase family 4 protein [Bacteroidota bacterium]